VPAVSIEVPEDPTGAVVIQLVGEVDIYDGLTIRAAAATAVAARRPVTINCQDLTFMDSSVLVLFAKFAGARLPMTVTGMRPHLVKLLQLTGLDRFITFDDH